MGALSRPRTDIPHTGKTSQLASMLALPRPSVLLKTEEGVGRGSKGITADISSRDRI